MGRDRAVFGGKRKGVDEVGLDETDRRLMQCIELGEWGALCSPDAWRWQAARELYLTPRDLERRLDVWEGLRGLQWDSRQGTMVFCRCDSFLVKSL